MKSVLTAFALLSMLLMGVSSQSMAEQPQWRDRGDRDCRHDDRRGDRDHRRDRRRCDHDRRDRDHGHDRGEHRPPQFKQGEEFFTVSGIRLGYVTKDEMRALGGQKDPEFNYYSYAGFNFWFHYSPLIYQMHMVTSNALPTEWVQNGLTNEISYDEVYSLLQSLGFTVTVIKAPKQEYYDRGGYYAFTAEIEGSIVNQDKKALKLKLDFSYNRGTSSSRGTLYSITASVK